MYKIWPRNSVFRGRHGGVGGGEKRGEENLTKGTPPKNGFGPPSGQSLNCLTLKTERLLSSSPARKSVLISEGVSEGVSEVKGRRPTRKTTHPNKNSLHKQFAQTLSACFLLVFKGKGGTVCTNCPEIVCANSFFVRF